MQGLPPANPGVYPGGGKAALLRSNEQQYLFQQQAGAQGLSSIAVQLERRSGSFYPFAASLQIWFTDINGNPANPGTFEIDAQTSDVDLDGQYCVESSGALTSLNSSYAGRIALTAIWAKFLRVNAKTVTNAVYLNVLVTR